MGPWAAPHLRNVQPQTSESGLMCKSLPAGPHASFVQVCLVHGKCKYQAPSEFAVIVTRISCHGSFTV